MDWPRALTNSSGTATVPRTANHARSAVAVAFQRGSTRSRRPLPWTRMVIEGRVISVVHNPVSSDTRRPLHTARCNMARSRIPARVAGSGASSKAWTWSWARYGTRRVLVFLKGDGQDATNLFECGWLTMLQESEERADCSETGVARIR